MYLKEMAVRNKRVEVTRCFLCSEVGCGSCRGETEGGKQREVLVEVPSVNQCSSHQNCITNKNVKYNFLYYSMKEFKVPRFMELCSRKQKGRVKHYKC